MEPLAAKYEGFLIPGSLLGYPELRFEKAHQKVSVVSMPNGGTGAPGPFTIVRLSRPFNTTLRAAVQRAPALIRGTIAAWAPERQSTTGDAAFDQAFRLEQRDQAIFAKLLDAEMRARLQKSTLPILRLALKDATVRVSKDGLAKSNSEIEEMIAIAGYFAARCKILVT